MKIKTLAIAAATLAVGAITSQAQVYSQNIVGYVNVTNTPGQLTLIANPLDNGTNTLNSFFPTAANGSTVQIWNGTGFSSATKLPAGWSPNSYIAPGTGFFLKMSAGLTNTFTGQINCPAPGSVTNALLAGTLVLVTSPIPFTDTLNGTNLNLKVANGSTVQIWNGTGYASSTKLPAGWSPNSTVSVGQGFFLKSNTATNWIQTISN